MMRLIRNRGRLFWAGLAFVLLIAVPLYAALVIVVVRTDLLDVDGDAFTDEQYKAIWAFLGVALGTAATILGALLTKSSNDRTLAQQQEIEGRQKLDTAVQALTLIKQGEKYAPTAVTAGALATLVHLGHPTIAMRATEVAVRDKAVAVETAVWLIDQVLSGGVTEQRTQAELLGTQEAAWLLDSIASDLTDASSGSFYFPPCAIAAWPSGLLEATHRNVLESMIEMLVSQDYQWWADSGGSWTWVLYSIDELVQEPSVTPWVRQVAATYGNKLLTVVGQSAVDGITGSRDPEEVKARLAPHATASESDLPNWDAVSRWCDAAGD